ncbi:MAG: kelch repeat-containing protein, partial [Candidatus Poribacteria bacterium]
QGFAAGVANGKIYVFGGGWRASMGLSTVEEYDPIKDKWEKKNDMPTARGWMARNAPTVNGKIYVIGGWNPIGNPTLTLPTVEEYDPVTDTWIKKADMPTPRSNLAVAELNSKIYAIGGASFDAGGNIVKVFSTVEEYDTETDTWTKKADMPTARFGFATSSLNGKIYAIGGMENYQMAFSTVEEYDTGFISQSVNSQNKLSSTWGNIKSIK